MPFLPPALRRSFTCFPCPLKPHLLSPAFRSLAACSLSFAASLLAPLPRHFPSPTLPPLPCLSQALYPGGRGGMRVVSAAEARGQVLTLRDLALHPGSRCSHTEVRCPLDRGRRARAVLQRERTGELEEGCSPPSCWAGGVAVPGIRTTAPAISSRSPGCSPGASCMGSQGIAVLGPASRVLPESPSWRPGTGWAWC